MAPAAISLADRFWPKVSRADNSNDCWNWNGAIDRYGYGKIGNRNTTLKAHRVAWMITNGDVPSGLFVCHTCDNRRCVNPAHLFVGTNAENLKDASRKGRFSVPRRPRTRHTKLTAADAVSIRALLVAGEPRSAVAHRFGVSAYFVRLIERGIYWRHAA